MSLRGIKVQKPLYRAWQQDYERVHKWETEQFSAIKRSVRQCSLPTMRASVRTITRARPGHWRDRRPWYSPQLNPDEQVWAHVKRRVSRHFVKFKDEMQRLALGILSRIQKLPKLFRLLFGHNECLYARM